MPPTTDSTPELDLLAPGWTRGVVDEGASGRWRISFIVSAVLHAVLIPLLPQLPSGASTRTNTVGALIFSARRNAPLVEPALPQPTKLTQKSPNSGKVSNEVSLSDLVPRPAVAPSPAPLRMPATSPAPSPILEPPKVEAAANAPLPGSGPLAATAPAPQIQAAEKPKNPFEKVGTSMGSSPTLARIEPPKTGIQEALRGAARSGGGVTVGDENDSAGGVDALGQRSRPGGRATQLELESDAQGVDFKPYMVQVLAAVRRNWFAVFPESARLGQRGRVVIVFSIQRNGRIGKLVFGSESGISGLDRAAVAGVSASSPFPPLPDEFRGNEIRLRMVFAYNMPQR